MKQKLIAIAKKSVKIKIEINLGGGMAEVSDQVVDPFLEEKVRDSATPLDDGIKAYLMPEIKKGLVELGEKADEFLNGKLAKIPFINK